MSVTTKLFPFFISLNKKKWNLKLSVENNRKRIPLSLLTLNQIILKIRVSIKSRIKSEFFSLKVIDTETHCLVSVCVVYSWSILWWLDPRITATQTHSVFVWCSVILSVFMCRCVRAPVNAIILFLLLWITIFSTFKWNWACEIRWTKMNIIRVLRDFILFLSPSCVCF